MTENDDFKGQNLILDPDFSQLNNGVWQQGGKKLCSKKTEKGRKFLFIPGKCTISQTVTLPISSSGVDLQTPYYYLTIDYKIKNSASTSLTLSFLQGDKVRTTTTIPLTQADKWTILEQSVALSAQDTALRVEFNGGDLAGNKGLHLGSVDLQLHLEALQAELITLNEEQLSAVEPQLRLNHGYSYLLDIKPKAGGQWNQLECALNWHSEISASNYAIDFEPALKVAQILSDDGAKWKIECLPYKPSHQRGEFELALSNYYSAAPFIIKAELDNFLYKFADPVIEGIAVISTNTPAKLKIWVMADYQPQYEEKLGIADVEVRWQVAGEQTFISKTSDKKGLVTFDFLPEKAGKYTLNALMNDKTGREIKHSFTLNVYAKSPWFDNTKLSFDNDAFNLQDDVIYLRNGQTHTLHLDCEDDSRDLFGNIKLSLPSHITENMAGITITPEDARAIPAQGLDWKITLHDVNSQKLALYLESDQFDIPQDIQAYILQDEVEKELKSLEINGQSFSPSDELLISPQQKTILRCITTDNITGLQASLNSTTKDVISAEPSLGTHQTLSNNEASWVLQSHYPQGGILELTVDIAPLSTPLTLTGRVLPQEINSGIEQITLDKTAITVQQTLVLTKGLDYTLELKPNALLYGMAVWLEIEADLGMEIITEPVVNQQVTLDHKGTCWHISSTDKSQSGHFNIQIKSSWGGNPITLSANLLSNNLIDDVQSITLDNNVIEKNKPLLLITEQTANLNIIPNKLLVDNSLVLRHDSGISVSAQPKINESVLAKEDGAKWQLTTGKERGKFALSVTRNGKEEPMRVSGYILSPDLKDEIIQISLNDKLLTEQKAFLLQEGRDYDLCYKPAEYLTSISVSLNNPTQNEIVAEPPFNTFTTLPKEGKTWRLMPSLSHRGPFTLELQSEQKTQKPLSLQGNLLSTKLQDEVMKLSVDPNMVGMTYTADLNCGLVLLAMEDYTLSLKLNADSLLVNQSVSLELFDSGLPLVPSNMEINSEEDPQVLPASKKAYWDISYKSKQDLKFSLLLKNDIFSYTLPCRVFSDESFLMSSGCKFFLDDKKIKPDTGYQKITRNKEVTLKLILSEQALDMLEGLSLGIASSNDGADKPKVSPLKPIIVKRNQPTLEWKIKHNITFETRFTLEVELANSLNVRTIIKCISN